MSLNIPRREKSSQKGAREREREREIESPLFQRSIRRIPPPLFRREQCKRDHQRGSRRSNKKESHRHAVFTGRAARGHREGFGKDALGPREG